MLIRKPYEDENESIIHLLKESLGESLIKKSTAVWKFKHIENPFGKSYVLVGEEKSELVGVRALMQWRWQFGNEKYVSYRAVDTATHPNHQGKGVFKKLTLKALEDVQNLGESFVFNTPNEQSRPGYIKMGWQAVGKIRVALIPTIFYFYKLFSREKMDSHSISDEQLEDICAIHNSCLEEKKSFFTPKSPAYLKWRYEYNPMQEYMVLSTSQCYISMYVKRHKFFNELRVAEIIGEQNSNKNQIQNTIIQYAFKHKCILISLSNKNIFNIKIFGQYGPILTYRELDTPKDITSKALQIENWSYSLGDLELF